MKPEIGSLKPEMRNVKCENRGNSMGRNFRGYDRRKTEGEENMKRDANFSRWWRMSWVAVLMVVVAGVAGCSRTAEEPAVGAETTYYSCPMHPQIIRDQPGTCPICNMDLVPVEDGRGHEGHGHISGDSGEAGDGGNAARAAVPAGAPPEIRVAASALRILGARTTPVVREAIARALRVDGLVAPDEARVVSVPARVAGYAEVVRVTDPGQTVRRGETLAELYAPDVVVALDRFVRAGEGTGERAEARRRLLNWGVSEGFLDGVARSGRVPRRFPVEAPRGGVVLAKNVYEGQSVGEGAELYRIADLSTVWVSARVWQSDLSWVREGARATVRLRNLPGRTFESTVFFVSPELDPATRTAEVRLRLANTPAHDLRPGMLAEVTLHAPADDSALTVPAHALIRAGARDVAVVSLGGGRFRPREVTVGRTADGRAEILAGLAEGEEVVTAAQFLLDSESNLRAAVDRLRATEGTDGTMPEGGHAH